MALVIRGEAARLRTSFCLLSSGTIHGFVLLWLVLEAAFMPLQRPKNIYDQEIRGHEKHIIWYRLSEKLPSVRPDIAKGDSRLPRARVKFPQTVVAGAKDDARPAQLIRMPAPEISLPKPLPLPNLLAVAPAPAARTFTPPEARTKTITAPAPLPEPPSITGPSVTKAAVDAPAPRPVRAFSVPAAQRHPATEQAVLDAPSIAAPSPTELAKASMAIVGLTPSKLPEPPAPAASHEASFSAGPEVRTEGGAGATKESAVLVAPGLMIQGGPKDAQSTLMSAIAPLSRQTLMAGVATPTRTPPPAAARVSNVPDPRFEGRVVYTVAIQMPNITSHSGSWIVWFAEREPTPGAPRQIRPPQPLHKVDPKYIPSAQDERVEGVVRLAAVIRKDGKVQQVELVRHLDERLDRSATEALSKWEFEPALRDGSPVEIDAVFEIPFRLAPRAAR